MARSNCVAKFPVWFTGEQKPEGYLVKQEFKDNESFAGYLEGLSQYNGSAIWLRVLDDWSGKWLGLDSQYIVKVSVTRFGQVNGYGLGTLLHEALHKKDVGGGFTHPNMSQALGLSACGSSQNHNSCSNAIATKCFPD